jgi:hypothetical protein
MPPTETSIRHKSNARQLKRGDKWSRHSYGEVVDFRPGAVTVRNEHGLEWTIDASLFEKEFNVADQYAKVEKVNRTEMVEKITAAARLVMTVHFRKKPEHKTLTNLVTELLDGNISRPGPRKLSTMLKEATAGEERTMIGRHYGVSDEFGRLRFTAMEKDGGLRLIDPRTVEWAVIDGVKYELKGK